MTDTTHTTHAVHSATTAHTAPLADVMDTANASVSDAPEDALRAEIEALVETATGRVVTVDDLRSADGVLDLAGVNSIGYINLLEALEQRFGLVVDPEADPHYLRSVDSIVRFVLATRA